MTIGRIILALTLIIILVSSVSSWIVTGKLENQNLDYLHRELEYYSSQREKMIRTTDILVKQKTALMTQKPSITITVAPTLPVITNNDPLKGLQPLDPPVIKPATTPKVRTRGS